MVLALSTSPKKQGLPQSTDAATSTLEPVHGML